MTYSNEAERLNSGIYFIYYIIYFRLKKHFGVFMCIEYLSDLTLSARGPSLYVII